jgi:drug/metabolite transporter (DMT)-like permease
MGRAGDYGLLLVLSLIWGLAFVAIRELDTQLGFVNLTLLRWLVATAGYLALLPIVGRAKAKLDRSDLPRLLLIGFLNVAVYHFALNYGEVTVSAGLSGLLITLGPVFSVLLAAAFLREKVGARLVLALVLAMAGAAVLFAGDLPAGVAPWGPLAVVLAALSYAMFGLLAKPLVQKYGALHVAIWAGVVGTIMILPLIPASFLSDVSRLPPTGWEALLYLSLLSTVAGYSMFYTLVGRVGVSRLMIQLYLAPVVSVVGGVLLLGETVTTDMLFGGALMLLAVWLATTRRRRA